MGYADGENPVVDCCEPGLEEVQVATVANDVSFDRSLPRSQLAVKSGNY